MAGAVINAAIITRIPEPQTQGPDGVKGEPGWDRGFLSLLSLHTAFDLSEYWQLAVQRAASVSVLIADTFSPLS